MAYIRTIPLEESTGKLRELYDEDIKNTAIHAPPLKHLACDLSPSQPGEASSERFNRP